MLLGSAPISLVMFAILTISPVFEHGMPPIVSSHSHQQKPAHTHTHAFFSIRRAY